MFGICGFRFPPLCADPYSVLSERGEGGEEERHRQFGAL